MGGQGGQIIGWTHAPWAHIRWRHWAYGLHKFLNSLILLCSYLANLAITDIFFNTISVLNAWLLVPAVEATAFLVVSVFLLKLFIY